jgi:hypothetical protein
MVDHPWHSNQDFPWKPVLDRLWLSHRSWIMKDQVDFVYMDDAKDSDHSVEINLKSGRVLKFFIAGLRPEALEWFREARPTPEESV